MWATLIPIIAQHGLEFAMKLWEYSQESAAPTKEQFVALLALSTTYNQRVEMRATALGVDSTPFKV
jgi:hypothetical protein